MTDHPVEEYKLHFIGWNDHPVTDGGDFDLDCTPDALPSDFYGGHTEYIVRGEER